MKFYAIPLCIFLVSCASVQTVTPVIEPTFKMQPTLDATPTTASLTVATPTAKFSPTSTVVPCDPYSADYCITDGHFILQRPIKPPGNDSVDPTYRYASTALGTRDPHHGVEFLNNYGTPVYAATDGVVLFAGPDKTPIYSPWKNFYGNLIVIRHADGLFTLYAHLSTIDVKESAEVQAGEKIGEVGKSGSATGSHLHFEVRVGGDGYDYGSTQNPEIWLVPRQNSSNVQYGAVAVSIRDEASLPRFGHLTLQRYGASSDTLEKTYYLDAYVDKMPVNNENAAMSDLPPGRYRIALKLDGLLYQRWTEVKSGKLTQVVIVVK